MPGHEPGRRRMIRMQVPADHPGAHVIERRHLHRPRRPDPLAVAVQHQRHHHRRVIRRAALPVRPVPRQERRDIHPRRLLQQPPRQMPGRQPLPRIRRHQEQLLPLRRHEVIHNSIFPGQSPLGSLTRRTGKLLTRQDHELCDSLPGVRILRADEWTGWTVPPETSAGESELPTGNEGLMSTSTSGAGERAGESALDPAVAARLKRDAAGLFPAIAQQHDTGEVLMLGWMDDEALHRTLTTGRCTYWSRSRQEYWVKGET